MKINVISKDGSVSQVSEWKFYGIPFFMWVRFKYGIGYEIWRLLPKPIGILFEKCVDWLEPKMK